MYSLHEKEKKYRTLCLQNFERKVRNPDFWAKSGPKWPKKAQSDPKGIKSGPKWPKVAKSGPKWPKVAQKGQK